MENTSTSHPFRINFISLICHLPVNTNGRDRVFLKHEGKRLYPKGARNYLDFSKGGEHKFKDLSIVISKEEKVLTVMIELWKYNWFFKSSLVGRFFFIMNVSEIGFSATQLIRNSEYHQSNYLLHWEKRSIDPVRSENKVDEKQIVYVKP